MEEGRPYRVVALVPYPALDLPRQTALCAVPLDSGDPIPGRSYSHDAQPVSMVPWIVKGQGWFVADLIVSPVQHLAVEPRRFKHYVNDLFHMLTGRITFIWRRKTERSANIEGNLRERIRIIGTLGA